MEEGYHSPVAPVTLTPEKPASSTGVEPATSAPSPSGGCLHELKWLGAGLVLSCFSLTFYRLASRRKGGWAILFLSLFFVVSLVFYTVGMAVTMLSVGKEIAQAFDDGKFPEITVKDGIATVDAEQPFVVVDERNMIVVLDTTGTYTSLDRSQYEQGMLLTRDAFHVLNKGGRYQEVPLEQLQALLNQNPMIIDRDWAVQMWTWLSVFVSVFMFLMMFLWNIVLRAVYLGIGGLLIWAVVVLFRPTTKFTPILSAGVYATVPAVYLGQVTERFGLGFIGLQYLLHIPFWGIALAVVLSQHGDVPMPRQVPWHGWREWLAAPMLLVLALDLLMFVLPVSKFVLLGITLGTLSVLIILSTIDRLKQGETPRGLGSPTV
jgi:hypothetical protein